MARAPFPHVVLPSLLANPGSPWFGPEGRDAVLRRALSMALDELETALGPDQAGWTWGALHQVRLAHPLARIDALAPLFTAGVARAGGDRHTVNQAAFEFAGDYRTVVIPSWRHIADLGDIDGSLSVLPTGQSGNPASPHWNDQLPLWSAGEHHAMPFTREAVEAAAVSTLTLSPV